MPLFSFEIARAGKLPLVVQTKNLDGFSALWREVEALAEAVKHYSGATIRVKNAEGGIVILAGVATAIATMEKYRRQTRTSPYPSDAPAQFPGLRTLAAARALE